MNNVIYRSNNSAKFQTCGSCTEHDEYANVTNASTAASVSGSASYSDILPENLNIFSEIYRYSNIIESSPRKLDINEFINVFRREMFRYNNEFIGELNKIALSSDENSVDIIWAYKNMVAFFSFNNNDKSSYYGCIGEDLSSGEYISKSGNMPRSEYKLKAAQIIRFMIDNS